MEKTWSSFMLFKKKKENFIKVLIFTRIFKSNTSMLIYAIIRIYTCI